MNDEHGDLRPAGEWAIAGSNINLTVDDDAAMSWVIRMADPEAADWDGFMAWLESDPSNSGRYDQIATALQDAELAAQVSLPTVIRSDARTSRTRRLSAWIGGAVAATLVGVVGFGVMTETPRQYVVETVAGEQRIVALPDGTRVTLGGASKITLDRRDTRIATVQRGEVLFHVRHDARHPFETSVGALRLIDLGTVFDVKISRHGTRVSVAEGAVMVDPDGAAVRVDPGQSVISTGRGLRRLSGDAADVGGWQSGRLVFDDASLDEVAEDLSRQLGRHVAAARSTAGRTFRGTLAADAIKNNPRLLEALLNVNVRQDASGWTLEPRR